MKYRTNSIYLGLVRGLLLGFAALASFTAQTRAQSLMSAETFGVLGATTVTNTGATQVVGNVGVSPGSAITGFPPGVVLGGALHAADATAEQAHADFASAYTAFSGLAYPPANNLSGQDLGGVTLTPGVYHFDTTATSGGVLTFDAQNDPTARFVIQVGTSFITTGASSVTLINQADARNIYFEVGSAVTLGSGSSFIGNLMAGTSVTAVGGTTVTGRLLALTGAVSMDTNQVSNPGITPPTPTPTPSPGGTPTPTPPPAQLLNISTRVNVQTGYKVSIAGFIITGNANKSILVRGMGPSLTGIESTLADPVLELHAAKGGLITSNKNWKDTQQTAIQKTTLAPTNNLEAAILANLVPGSYTAILSGNDATSGVGLVEIYDTDPSSDSALANISTRGFVGLDSNVMIGGFILGNGTLGTRVLVRALGPSLATVIPGVLPDPTLSLYDSNGVVILSDDNWKDNPAQAAIIMDSGLAPTDDLEPAMVVTLLPGAYTAIVSGKSGKTGVALAEVYHLTP